MDEIDALHGFFRVFRQRDLRAALAGKGLAHIEHRLLGPVGLRGTDADIHAHLRADHEKRIPGVETGVTHVGEADLVKGLVAVLTHRKEVTEHLRRMPFIGEAVEDRNAGVLRELFHGLLGKAAVLDRVIDLPEHPGRILHALLVAELRGRRVKECRMRALIGRCHFKGAPRTG